MHKYKCFFPLVLRIMLSNKEATNEVDKPKENRQREESMHLEFCTVYEHQLSTCWAFFHFRHPGVLESHLSPDWWNGGIDRKHRRWRGGWDEQQYHRHKWYRLQAKIFYSDFFSINPNRTSLCPRGKDSANPSHYTPP